MTATATTAPSMASPFKKNGMLTAGYIQFSIHGGRESRGGVFDATKDENSIMFGGGNTEKSFLKAKELIEQRMSVPGCPLPLARWTN